jgi:hypothetical protein
MIPAIKIERFHGVMLHLHENSRFPGPWRQEKDGVTAIEPGS